MSRVLVVEDEAAIADLLRTYLVRDGFEVELAADGLAALQAVDRRPPDAVVLDVGLPGLDGTEVCRRMRAAGDWTPVLFVTARDDELDRVLGLELGADDYVTKPFSPREVVARVRAVLRRRELPGATAATGAATANSPRRLQLGRLSLDLDTRTAQAAGAEVELTTTEFDLLAHLVRQPGRVCAREELLAEVWGYPQGVLTRTVDVHVAQLRGKLGDALRLRTVRGVGYAAQP
jgi:DNA-binding response OmpR family regulator